MRLVVAIVQDRDSFRLIDALVSRGHRVTRVNTVGGFLRQTNVTLLIGTEDEKVGPVLDLIGQHCQTRNEPFILMDDPLAAYSVPLDVEVGGAIVFVLPVVAHETLPETSDHREVHASFIPRAEVDKLVVAIVQAQDASRVVSALVGRGYAATHINSFGGFLRRGNAIILTGVTGQEVRDAILTIGEHCCARKEAASPKVEIGAGTIFVLDVVRFEKM